MRRPKLTWAWTYHRKYVHLVIFLPNGHRVWLQTGINREVLSNRVGFYANVESV